MKLWHDEYFQGRRSHRRYFEGWYFKHVSADLRHVISIIPGVSLTKTDPHGFIQILNGVTGSSEYIRYPLAECDLSSTSFHVRIGQSTFTGQGINLDVATSRGRLTGAVQYSNIARYPSSFFSPGIMGWYSFVPFMECKHGVYSMRHTISGHLMLDGQGMDFTGGTGYIEKDWGRSFPESWVWAQGNVFSGSDAAFMLSVAKIPWLGKYFIGTIAFLSIGNTTYSFATYNGAKVRHLSMSGRQLAFVIEHAKYSLRGTVTQKTNGALHAPVSGTMSRMIKESADADIALQLLDRRGQVLFTGDGKHAGLEVIEGIFQYFH